MASSCVAALVVVVVVGVLGYGSKGCLEEEKVGLLKLKDAFHHAIGTALSSWGSSGEVAADCCRWEGVTCDHNKTNRVTELHLHYIYSGLEKWSLNASLLLPFHQLQFLDLSGNRLTGIQDEVKLEKLRVLDLSWNCLTTISTLRGLRRLKVLNLAYNNLDSCRLQGLGKLSNLQELDFSYNKIEWNLPLCFHNLTSLRTLDLSWNNLNDSQLQGLCKLSNLQELDVGGNNLDRNLPFCFNNLTSLRTLDLSMSNLNDSQLQGLCKLSNLQELDVSGNNLKRNLPFCFNDLTSLRTLDLSRNDLKYSQLQGLKYLSRLEVLKLAGLKGSRGSMSSYIGTLNNLRSLSLSENNLNDSSSMEGLCKLSRLQELDISGNRMQGNLPLCFHNLTFLRMLDLSWNNFEGANIPSSLLSSLKLLEYISLSGNGFEGSLDFTSLFNHSKLVVFELDNNNNKNLKVETETSSTYPVLPRFQLRVFCLSNCILNQESGVIPSFLSNQYELRILVLNNVGIRGGDIPHWLFVNNSKLESFSLRGNHLTGPLSLGLHSKQPHLRYFDISSNHIQGHIPPDIGFIFPNLGVLNMSRNAVLHGDFPPSIGNMKSLILLDLSNNNLSGVLPPDFLKSCILVEKLILSNNKFQGKFLTTSDLTSLRTLFLDNNSFSGKLSIGLILKSPSLELLNLGNNSFSGQIPDSIGNFPNLVSLVLSGNHLEGIVPKGFCKLGKLKHLDLSWNKLGPSIPSCFNLSNMKYLHLQNNKLTGVIPDVLSRGRSLVILDLKDNKFWGTIPPWIGSLTSLEVLILGGNELNDSIPSHLCWLQSMRMLDLSHNIDLSGSIPPCLNNLTFGRKGAQDRMFLTTESGYAVAFDLTTYSYESKIIADGPSIDFHNSLSAEGEEVGFTTKWRFESYEGGVLPIMSGMDLSSNNLTGAIPPELGDLSQIHSLNLSNNHLTGIIPATFSNLKEIESLDLSHNMLNGQIPPEFIEFNNLGTFTVAYNNLSGKLPEWKAQFTTFEESNYEGNPLLCGLPLNRSCTTPGARALPPTPSSSHNNKEEENESWETVFFWSFGGSFGVAFIGTLAFLYLNNYYRELLFYFFAKYIPFLPMY